MTLHQFFQYSFLPHFNQYIHIYIYIYIYIYISEKAVHRSRKSAQHPKEERSTTKTRKRETFSCYSEFHGWLPIIRQEWRENQAQRIKYIGARGGSGKVEVRTQGAILSEVSGLAVAKGGVRQKWGRGPTSCSKRGQKQTREPRAQAETKWTKNKAKKNRTTQNHTQNKIK